MVKGDKFKLIKRIDNMWVIGVWFFETADVLETYPNIR
jgi:hypothetical protein